MEIALQFTQDILEDEVKELKPLGSGVLYVAVALYFTCNVIAVVIYAFVTGSAWLPSYLLFLLIFNILSYGIGQFLDGTRSEVGHQVMEHRDRFTKMTGTADASGALGVMAIALMVAQFLCFGVYTCVEQFRDGLKSRGDNRSRIAAALVKYLLENGPASESKAAQELQRAGIEKQQAIGIIEYLKDKTVLQTDQEKNLTLTVPARRWFPT